MKNISLPFKIGILLLLAILIVLTIGYISYRSMQSIVSSISVEAKPDYTLLSLKDISLELEKAENNIRIYSLSKSKRNLYNYYNAVNAIDDKIASLKNNAANEQLNASLDTLSFLIQDKQYIWNEMLLINEDDVLAEKLKSLSDTLLKSDTIVRRMHFTDTVIVKPLPKAQSDEEEPAQQPGFFQRLFGNKPSPPKQEQAVIEAKKKNTSSPDSVEYVSTLSDTIIIEQKNELKPQEIVDMITEVEVENEKINSRLRREELKLAETNSRLTEKFYLLMEDLEYSQQKKLEQKAENADLLARKTYLWLSVFTATVSLLAILVLFTVARSIRKSIKYQRALELSKKEAENLVRTKEIFTANVSHEIRTPLNAIYGFLKQINTDSMEIENQEKIQLIQSSSENLLRIVNDVLDFSKMEAGRIKAENIAFELRVLLNETNTLFNLQASRNNSELNISATKNVSKVLIGDPYRLKQLIFNLVSNAIKFTHNGRISVLADQKNISNSQVELILTISDTGIGIAPDKTSIIFEDYTQAEAGTTQRYGGTGLGLSIVKKIIDLFGGSINLESKLNEGSKFTCKIPLKAGTASQLSKIVTKDLSEQIGKLKNFKVLLADDEEYNRKLLKTILQKWKMSFVEAKNGLEAVDKLKTGEFSIALLDIRMPALDGQKTARFVRESMLKTKEEFPIIAITAAAGKEEKEKFLKAGFNEVISKPFDENELLNAMIELLLGNGKVPGVKNKRKPPKVIKHGIDFDELNRFSNNDSSFVKEMLDIFLQSFREGIQSLDKYLTEQDYMNISETAHKIASPCRHLGAQKLLHLTKEIEEKSAKKDQMNTISTLIDSLKNEFKTVEKQIMNKLAELK